jgi:hypothetical protein
MAHEISFWGFVTGSALEWDRWKLWSCDHQEAGIGSRYQNKVILALDEGSQEIRYARLFEGRNKCSPD